MKQYRFKIEYEGSYSYSWGYTMYSAFLEQLGKGQSTRIHEDIIFSQYIKPDEWVINSTESFEFKDKYKLEKFNKEITIIKKEVIEINEQELADRYLISAPAKKSVTLHFVTPTTFKQDGEYVLFPTKDLIMNSLTAKWNQWADRFVLEDIKWDNCKISKYNLRTTNYHMKGIKIQGFVGSVEIFFWGPESMIRLGNMICNYAAYSGTGIKAALGMGGTIIE